MHPIHGHSHHHGHMEVERGNRAMPHAETRDVGRADDSHNSGRAVIDQVDLSETAKKWLEKAGPGKSGQSPAHRARAILAERAGAANMPFGRVVSALNHGTLDSILPPAPTEAPAGEGEVTDPTAIEDAIADETAAVPDDTGDGSPAVVEDRTDPVETLAAPASDEPAVDEATDQTAAPDAPDGVDTEVSVLDLIDALENDPEAGQPT